MGNGSIEHVPVAIFSGDTPGDPYIAPRSRRFNKHKNLAFYCERTNEISPSKLVGDVNIFMNIQYVAIISEMPDVSHVCRASRPSGGKEIVPHGVSAGHAWPSAREANGTERGRGRSSKRRYFGNRRIPIRRVGASFRNNRAILKATFRFTKHTPVGEIGTDHRRGGTEEHVYSDNVSACPESCFDPVLN